MHATECDSAVLKAVREQYEARLAGVTDRIRLILEDIKQDDVVTAMKDDPASASFVRARMREIAEGRLAQEKEDTIERLLREVAIQKSENARLEKEAGLLRTSARGLEDQLRQERMKTEASERELLEMRSRSTLSDRQYEDSLRRAADDSSSLLKQTQSEAEKLREKAEKADRALILKTSEVEFLKRELDTEKGKTAKLLVEQSSLKRAYQDLECDYTHFQSSDQRLSGALKEVSALQTAIETYEHEKEELRSKYLAYSREFKEVLEAEQKHTSDVLESLQKQHKTKSSLFKKKILEQKGKIKSLESDICELKSELEATRDSYGQSLGVVQSDLHRVRDEWEARCRSVEEAGSKALAEAQNRHKAEIAALQLQTQAAVDAKARELQLEFERENAKRKDSEATLRRTLEEKLESECIRANKQEMAVQEEVAKARSATARAVEEQLAAEFAKRLAQVAETHEGEVQKLTTKLKTAESREEAADTQRRKAERELEYANERLGAVSGKLSALSSELTDAENCKKSLTRTVDESTSQISKLKTACEDEVMRRKAAEEFAAGAKDRIKSLESSLNQQEVLHSQEIHTLKLRHIAETTEMQEAIEHEQSLTRKLMAEIQKLRDLQESLQSEKRELSEFHAQATDELKHSSMRVRQEGESRYESEVSAHRDTRLALESQTQLAESLQEELADAKRVLGEESTQSASFRREIEQLSSQLSEKQQEVVRISIEKEAISSAFQRKVAAFDAFRSSAQKAIRSLVQEYQSRLRVYQKALQADLSEFKKFMSRQVAESVAGVEDAKLKQRRAMNLALLAKEDQIRSVEKEKAKCEQNLSESLDVQSRRYESHIDTLKTTIAQLKADLETKAQEISAIMGKMSEFQQEKDHLSLANQSLRSELDEAVQQLEDVKDEEQRLKSSFHEEILGREASISEKFKAKLAHLEEMVNSLKGKNAANMDRLQGDVRQLQDRHKEELAELETNYMRKIDDMQRDCQRGEQLRLSEAVEGFSEELASLRLCSAQQLSLLEGEITELVSTLRLDQEKCAIYRQEKTAELEEFSKRLKLATRELREKDEFLERTNRDKEALRVQLKEIRDSMAQREISDLKGTLEKVRKGEDETTAERPKLAPSLSQLKASLDKF